ncbi:hypothetical protein K449DRAFT_431057 [Hypoxylon sp. EC38]|nr:hypothetical protein K449DRAFT_431057 [Hypoxylon sp. EC38]
MMSYLAKAPAFNGHMRTEFPYLKMATDTITIFAQCHCQSIRTVITDRQDATSGRGNEQIRHDVSKRRHERTTRKAMRQRKPSRKLGQGVGDVPLNIKPRFLSLPPHLSLPISSSSSPLLSFAHNPTPLPQHRFFLRGTSLQNRHLQRPPWCDKYYGWVMWSAIPAHQHPGESLQEVGLRSRKKYHWFYDFAILGYLPRYSTSFSLANEKGEKILGIRHHKHNVVESALKGGTSKKVNRLGVDGLAFLLRPKSSWNNNAESGSEDELVSAGRLGSRWRWE